MVSAVLYSVYYFILSRKKILVFNRFYLLLIMVIAFIIPQLNITVSVSPVLRIPANTVVLNEALWPVGGENVTEHTQPGNDMVVTAVKENINYRAIAVAIYFMGVLAMLLVFIKKLWRINKITGNYKTVLNEPIIRLLPYKIMPFSFGKNIYLNEVQYINNEIETCILEHEKAHTAQLHTADIILAELLHIIFWFNPVMICIKKSVKINHEYLADAVAVRKINIKAYQEKIIDWSVHTAHLQLTSSFNYITIKKRLLMLQASYKFKNVIMSVLLALMVITFCIIIFGKYNVVSAQNNPSVALSQPAIKSIDTPRSMHQSYISVMGRQIPNGPGAAETELQQYEQLLQNNLRKNERGQYVSNMGHFSAADYETAKKIYTKMNGLQRSLSIYRLVLMHQLTPINTPTAQQFAGFKNAATYGVWVDDKKVTNATLNQFRNTDFGSFYISKLYNKAKEGKLYTHQVDLYTKKYVNSSNEALRTKLDSLSLFVVYPSFSKAGNAGSTRFNEVADIALITEKNSGKKVKLTLKNGTTQVLALQTAEDNSKLEEQYGIVYRFPGPLHK